MIMTSYVYLVRYVVVDDYGTEYDEFAYVASVHADVPRMSEAVTQHPRPESVQGAETVVDGPLWSEVTA